MFLGWSWVTWAVLYSFCSPGPRDQCHRLHRGARYGSQPLERKSIRSCSSRTLIIPAWPRRGWPRIFVIVSCPTCDKTALLMWIQLATKLRASSRRRPNSSSEILRTLSRLPSWTWWPAWIKSTWSGHRVTSETALRTLSRLKPILFNNFFVFLSWICFIIKKIYWLFFPMNIFVFPW